MKLLKQPGESRQCQILMAPA